MRKMDGLEVDHKKIKSVQEAMPEGQFKLTKEAYINQLKECINGDLSYVNLK
jgi:hypothetical protein